MRKVWWVADSVTSPLGSTTAENYDRIRLGMTGLQTTRQDWLSPVPVCVSMTGEIPPYSSHTGLSRFENLCLHTLHGLIGQTGLHPRTLFILSSTKGNIEWLDKGIPDHPRIHLHPTATFLADQFGLSRAMVVSNACISGVTAMIVAKRFIETGKADHAVVLGADVLSRFVVAGFQSLQAVSVEPCKPFDLARKGTNLGEAAAAVMLSATPEVFGKKHYIAISGGGLSNDANHISGPSRTGEELAIAIRNALNESGRTAENIDFVSAHGTATLYNDEMEAKAFHLMGLQETPVQSLKGYFGHTLGAAGVLETILTVQSMKRNETLPTRGFDSLGVSLPLNVCAALTSREMKTVLKTASGFGGCNAAMVLENMN